MTAIRLENITKRFGGTTALDSINLEIAAGELFFLLGPSGCGKSTLLRTIAGLIPTDSGRLLFNGRDVTDLSTEHRNAVMCFQSYALWPHMTVQDNVRFGLSVRGETRVAQQQRIEEVLKLVQMQTYAERKPNQLSGGQQQRVALARALAPNPAILVADEPTGNLDEGTGRDIIELLFRGHSERGTTLVLVTHDSALAARCDRVLHMRSGQIESRKTATPIATPTS